MCDKEEALSLPGDMVLPKPEVLPRPEGVLGLLSALTPRGAGCSLTDWARPDPDDVGLSGERALSPVDTEDTPEDVWLTPDRVR